MVLDISHESMSSIKKISYTINFFCENFKVIKAPASKIKLV